MDQVDLINLINAVLQRQTKTLNLNAMKNEFVLLSLSLFAGFQSYAQTESKDAYGDQHNTATGWIQNKGQKLNTSLTKADGLAAYADGYGMDIWLMKKGKFKLSKTLNSPVAGQNDTTFCVSLEAVGTAAHTPDPVATRPLPGLTNFYYPHTDSLTEDVLSYHREIYWGAWTHISMQFYTSRVGPKLALVCEPGSDPNNIKLQIEGQDSLKVDIFGTLKMYTKG